MTLDDAPPLMTVSELASVLRIGRNSAYDLVSSGEVRSCRIGRRIRIPRAAVVAYLGLDPPEAGNAPSAGGASQIPPDSDDPHER